MKPAQVLEAQADLHARMNGRHQTYFKEAIHHQAGFWREGDAGAFERLYQRLAEQMALAHAYRVTEDMSATVQFAASKLDASDRIDVTLAPTDWGFVRFDQPLPVRDIRGDTMLVHFMSWGPARQKATGSMGQEIVRKGVVMTLWNDAYTQPDDTHYHLMETLTPEQVAFAQTHIGRWGYIGTDAIWDGEQVGPGIERMPEKVAARAAAEGVVATDEYTNTTRYLHALWLLLGQTITEVSEERLTKKQAARLAKAKIPGRVSVIRLRRVEYGRSHGESNIQWSRRWLVRGHWRWQPCGPGRTERVRIWISPFVKGPEGAPLIVPDKVYSLDR